MVCLIDTEETPDVGIITRFRRARRGYNGVKSRSITVLGVRALYITIDQSPSMTEKTLVKRIGAAAEMMRAGRAHSVVFSKNFPYRELVLGEGFDETDTSLLMETLGGKIAAGFSGKEKTAAFFARRLTGNAEQAFYEICRDFRYVMAAVESDGSRLITALGKRLGISVIGQPTEKQLLKADVALFYTPPTESTMLSEQCVAIGVNESALEGVVCRRTVTGITIAPADGSTPELPDGFAQEPLYALAIGAGKLRREDIRLRDINIDVKPI